MGVFTLFVKQPTFISGSHGGVIFSINVSVLILDTAARIIK
jgi:hypothetical protein